MTKYQEIVELWQSFNIQTEADLAIYLDSFRILFAYNSNKIENKNTTYVDTYEMFVNDKVTNYTGDVQTITEIQNQKRAWHRTLQAFAEREPITEAFVLEMQQIITEGTYDNERIKKGEHPGEYKKHHYVVGVNETGAAPETVAKEISELLDEITTVNIDETNLLTAAAYFHAKFENIHPFSDGNGRTGRTMMNYYLLLNNHPPITIYDEDRKGYYDALDAYHTTLDLEPLKALLKEQAVKTWEKTLERQRPRKLSINNKSLDEILNETNT